MAESINLLGSLSRVEIPFIKVVIGNYVFGVYDKETVKLSDINLKESFTQHNITYPNYIQSLHIQKLNGQVNSYTLNISYPVTQNSDPNFFEKVFSSISKSRKIIFSYGDLAAPTFIYRNEEAIINKVSSNFSATSSVISYTIQATSSSAVVLSTTYSFKARRDKPSDVIKELLYSPMYNLKEIFYGMKDKSLVEFNNLIPDNDKIVDIQAKDNISILDYLSYLVDCMTSLNDVWTKLLKQHIYILTISDDISGKYNGPYFKITEVKKDLKNISLLKKDILQTYEIDIGYPSQNIVTNFNIEDDSSYSILYNYQEGLQQENYVRRINDKGEMEDVYAPSISSKNSLHLTTEADRTWWTKVTSFPIKANITIKGLLRPAILMTHVKLNIYFYGQKHISSGTYIITKQIDQIDSSGFKTILNLSKVQGDFDF